VEGKRRIPGSYRRCRKPSGGNRKEENLKKGREKQITAEEGSDATKPHGRDTKFGLLKVRDPPAPPGGWEGETKKKN